MKAEYRPQSRKLRLNLKSHSFTLSRAKTFLGRLVDKAVKGEPVYIVRGQQRCILQYVPEIEPIPMRPPGYFANCYSREEIALDNAFSKASIIRAPQDLE